MQACNPDAIVLGGGLAGATVAMLLARAGREVTLLERSTSAHHKVCGEFLSREAVMYLERSGVDLARLGAVRIDRVRLAADAQIAEAALPFAAMSLTRRTLDEALLAKAEEAGVRVLRGCRVTSLTGAGGQWTARAEGGGPETISARRAFVATGKHDLPGAPRPKTKQNDLVAFKMYFRLDPTQRAALSRNVELILFPGGYAGLQAVEGEACNLCLLVTRSRLRACGGSWPSLLDHMQQSSRYLADRLQSAEALLEKPLALSAIPYGFVRRETPGGLWQLGDQAAVIPSFSGDGMSIALHSAHLAAKICLDGGDAPAFQRQMAADLRGSVGLAAALSRLMIAAPALAQLTRLWPGALASIATGTRVPAAALLSPLHERSGELARPVASR